MKQCTTCGGDLADDAAVCPDCGMELGASALPAAPRTVVLDADNFGQNLELSPSAPAASSGATLTLKRNGVLADASFPLGERAVIGRFDADTGPVDVDLAPLPEANYVSRRHAEIWREGDTWKLKDLGARNGTFIRGDDGKFQRIADEQTLGDGDEIALGNARFEFRKGA